MAYITSSENGRRYELTNQECILGRHPDCDVVIEVGAVSRRHARIQATDKGFSIEDLGSRNFTFLNGEKVPDQTQKLLQHGDRITICDVTFEFHSELSSSGDVSSGSSLGVLVDDDSQSSSSTIMSKLGVSSSRGRVQLAASPEAKLDALLEINQNLSQALALDEVLPKVLDSLFKIFVQADRGFIGLKNEKDVLIPRWSKARREDAEDTIRISRTIVNQVMDSQEAILSADAATDERFQMSQSIADFRIRSMMCAPLVDGNGNSMGVIQIDTLDQRKRFQEKDLEVLASIAAQAGIAIDNARMHERALQQKELQRDLEVATQVQKGFLPENSPEIDGYNFFDFYRPANHVGGDYFDYIPLNDGRTAIVVADVVGHGIAAALLMAKLSAEARFSLASQATPGAATTRLNEALSKLQIDRFVTMVMAVLDPDSHEVTIVNAGHMAPFLRRSDGTIEEPGEEEAGLPLGIAAGYEYEETKLQLDAGESLMMYTDGINEAMNGDGEFYGTDRIRDHVVDANGHPEEGGNRIIQDVNTFIGSGEQADDMCLVAVGRPVEDDGNRRTVDV